MRRAVVLACAALCVLAAGASARAPVNKAIWGPVAVNGRSQFPIYRDLGVDIFEYSLNWPQIAPTRPARPRDPNDPAYRWPADADMAVHEAGSSRMGVSMMLIGSPPWANGGQAPAVSPTPSDFADFAEAAARRYRRVHRWMIWGEPLRVENYAPIESDNPVSSDLGPIPARQSAAPRRYAVLLDRAYGRLKAVDRANLVIGGNTTTSGTISPYNWIRYMRLPDGRPPRMDLFGHNPFGLRRPRLSAPQLRPKLADFSDLDVLVRWIDRYLARGRRDHHLRLFISEYTAPTDAPSYEFGYHITRGLQASWLQSAFGIARSWSRIETLGWIGLRDLKRGDGAVSDTGLIDASGVRKPAYYVYKRAAR